MSIRFGVLQSFAEALNAGVAQQAEKVAYNREYENAKQVDRDESSTPVTDRLRDDANNLSSQLYRTARAQEILQRHPEFEELLELLSLVRVPIRIQPVQSFRAAVID